MTEFCISLAIVFELALCLIAVGLRVRSLGRSTPQAFARAAVLTMAAWSVAAQAVIACGRPGLYFLFDAGVVLFSLASLRRYRLQLREAALDIRRVFLGQRDFLLWAALLAFCYLAVQTLLVPPSNSDGFDYHLPRILLMIREKTLFIEHYNAIRQRAFPVGWDALFFPFLRFNTDFALGVYGFLGYLVLAAGGYGLAFELTRSRQASLTTALVLASSTKIALQALSVKNDLILGAVALTLFSSVWRMTRDQTRDKEGSSFDLFYILAASAFALSVKYYFAGFLAIFAAVFFVANAELRPAGLAARLRQWAKPRNAPLAALASACLGLCVAYAWANFQHFGSPFGPPGFVAIHKNKDGAAGASLNALRYAAELVDLPSEKIDGELAGLVDRVAGHGSRIGTAFDFKINTELRLARPDEDFCAFGPLIALAALAATVFAAFRGRGFVRRAAVIAPALYAVFCFALPWMPWNLRFFTLVFACAAPALAVFFQALSRRRAVLFCLGMLACANLFFTLASNNFYGLFPPFRVVSSGEAVRQFPYWLDLAVNRPAFYDARTGGALKPFVRDLRACGKILFLGDENLHLFPFLLAAKDVEWQVDGVDAFAASPVPGDAQAGRIGQNDPFGAYDLIVAVDSPASLAALPPYFTNGFDAPITFRSRFLANPAIHEINPLRAAPGDPDIDLVNIEFFPASPQVMRWMFGPRAAVRFHLPQAARFTLSFRIISPLPHQSLGVFANDAPVRVVAGIPAMGLVKEALDIDFPVGWNEIGFAFGDWNNKTAAYKKDDPRTYAAVLQDMKLTPILGLVPRGENSPARP